MDFSFPFWKEYGLFLKKSFSKMLHVITQHTQNFYCSYTPKWIKGTCTWHLSSQPPLGFRINIITSMRVTIIHFLHCLKGMTALTVRLVHCIPMFPHQHFNLRPLLLLIKINHCSWCVTVLANGMPIMPYLKINISQSLNHQHIFFCKINNMLLIHLFSTTNVLHFFGTFIISLTNTLSRTITRNPSWCGQSILIRSRTIVVTTTNNHWCIVQCVRKWILRLQRVCQIVPQTIVVVRRTII